MRILPHPSGHDYRRDAPDVNTVRSMANWFSDMKTTEDLRFLGPETSIGWLSSTGMTMIELVERHYYWKLPWLRKWYRARKGSPNRIPYGGPSWRRLLDEVLGSLSQMSYRGPPLLLVHSSMDGLLMGLSQAEFKAAGGDEVALTHSVLTALQDLMGTRGTLCMPTHPFYPYAKWGLGPLDDKDSVIPTFDPERTPSSVGLLTELFRRSPGVQRSEYPLSSMAVQGPSTNKLLQDNLCEEGLLPHGIHSSWSHFCEERGVVVGIGIPLVHHLTVIHCSEEVADAEWPIPAFFYERQFVAGRRNASRIVVVRERHPATARYISEQRYRRDLLREGVLHEVHVCGVQVDWAYSDEVLAVLRYYGTLCPGYPYFVPLAMRRRVGREVGAGGGHDDK